VCTEKAHFALDLLRLGKHNQNGPHKTTKIEEQILSKYPGRWFNASTVESVPNEIFLYDLTQLSDNDETRKEAFRRDVQSFLGLSVELPQTIEHYKPPKRHWNATVQAEKDERKIDICDDEYIALRRDLLNTAKLNSQWIRNTFMKLDSVKLSSPAYLNEVIEGWMSDPCGNQIDRVDSGVIPDKGKGETGRTPALLQGAFPGIAKKVPEKFENSSRLPPLSSIIDREGNILNDPQKCLDFAVIGKLWAFM
jgi:hypothetical protein